MTTALGIAGAGALLALVAFFLPWVRYQQATYSGFDLALAIAPALAGVAAGGLKGFHLALHAVPVLAAVTLACLGLAARQGRGVGGGASADRRAGQRAGHGEAAGRLLGWATAAAGAGLAITLLFAASGLLSGTPGTQFAPGLLRTDAAVPTNVARSLNAGGFLGLGAGVLLACAGFGTAVVGSAVAAGRVGGARAGDLRGDLRDGQVGGAGLAEGSLQTGAPDSTLGGAWRTQDYVFLAVLAIVSGALYWWWLQPYAWVAPLIPGAGQVAQEVVFGVWFLSGLLGAT